MPKSSAMYWPLRGPSVATKMLPGCMSAWKKPSRNTWVKKISTPARARRGMSTPFSRSSAICPMVVPCMRCITITLVLHQSQCTSGRISRSEPSKLRRSCEQLAASRIRSSS